VANFSTWTVRMTMFSSMVGGGLVPEPIMAEIGWEQTAAVAMEGGSEYQDDMGRGMAGAGR
jgi:hypothetical protein